MIRFRKLLVRFFFVAIIISIIVQLADATSMNFTVHGGEEATKSIYLYVNDRVLIRFIVVGQSDNNLNFHISFPTGTVEDFGEIGNFDYSFICNVEGTYVLSFSNINSSEDKLVTLYYENQHYIFGIPQMFFLAIIISIICVAAVAVFILMGRPS